MRERFTVPVLLGLAIAGAGVVSPILWDWWSKKAQLTVEVASVTSVVSNTQPIAKLQFSYDNQPIEELNQVILRVANTGRMPITSDDVVVPLTIIFGPGRTLEARIARKNPADLDARLQLLRNELVVSSALMNPEDSLELVVLTTSSMPEVRARARIRNISQVNVVQVSKNEGGGTDTFIAMLAIAVLGILFAGVGFIALREGFRKNRTLAALKGHSHRLLASESTDAAKECIESELGFLTGKQLATVSGEVSGASWPLPPQEKADLAARLIRAVSDEPAWGIFAFCLPIVMLCGYYLVNRLPALF